MKAKETFDNFINVGHEIHCDIAPQALEPDAWVATVAWIGGLDAKPDIEAINWHHQLNRNAQRGKIFFSVKLQWVSSTFSHLTNFPIYF